MTCSTFVTESRGAETVISEGAAHGCYVDASFSGSSAQSVATCSAALDAGTLSPEDRVATLVNRGILKERLSDFAGALSDYDQALVLRPDIADAYLDRGAVLIKLLRYKEAIADLTKSITLVTTNSHVAYYNRGLARERTGDLDGACADYRQSLAIQPNYAPPKPQLSICRYQVKPKTD